MASALPPKAAPAELDGAFAATTAQTLRIRTPIRRAKPAYRADLMIDVIVTAGRGTRCYRLPGRHLLLERHPTSRRKGAGRTQTIPSSEFVDFGRSVRIADQHPSEILLSPCQVRFSGIRRCRARASRLHETSQVVGHRIEPCLTYPVRPGAGSFVGEIRVQQTIMGSRVQGSFLICSFL